MTEESGMLGNIISGTAHILYGREFGKLKRGIWN